MGDFRSYGQNKRYDNTSNRKNSRVEEKCANNGDKISSIENYFKLNILKIALLNEEYDEFISKVKEYALFLKNEKMSTSQIRKIYSDIMSTETAMELKRLRPRLAYVYGRNSKNNAITSLLTIIDYGLEKLSLEDKEKEKESIKEFMETIVAYRKYYGDIN